MKLGKKEWARWAEWIERVKSDLPATVNDRAVFHWTAKGSTAGPRSRQGCGYPRRGCLQVHLSADRQGVQQLEGDGAVRLEEGLQGAAAETARVGPRRSASKGPPSRTWLLQSQGSRSPDLLLVPFCSAMCRRFPAHERHMECPAPANLASRTHDGSDAGLERSSRAPKRPVRHVTRPIVTQPAKQAELAPRLPKCQFAARIEMIANFKAA